MIVHNINFYIFKMKKNCHSLKNTKTCNNNNEALSDNENIDATVEDEKNRKSIVNNRYHKLHWDVPLPSFFDFNQNTKGKYYYNGRARGAREHALKKYFLIYF